MNNKTKQPLRLIKNKLVFFSLFSFTVFNPLFLLYSCSKKLQQELENKNDELDLFEKIKEKINEEFTKQDVEIFVPEDLNSRRPETVFEILNEQIKNIKDENDNLDISGTDLLENFKNKINVRLNSINMHLKTIYSQLSNLPKDVVEIYEPNLFLEKADYNDLKAIHDRINQKLLQNNSNLNFKSITLMKNDIETTLFKLKLQLKFKINITETKEEIFEISDRYYYITNNKEDVDSILSNLSKLLESKVKNEKFNLIDLINPVTKQYLLASDALKTKLLQVINSKFKTSNFDLELKIDEIIFEDSDLTLELPSLKHLDDGGKNYKDFINVTLRDEKTIIKRLLTDNKKIKELNNSIIPHRNIKFKKFTYTLAGVHVDNINIPAIRVNTFIVIDRNDYVQHLEKFRLFFKEYFDLSIIKGEEVVSDAGVRKQMKINHEALAKNRTWSDAPVKALQNYFEWTLSKKMKNTSKKYFLMHFSNFGSPQRWNNNTATHWYNITLTFKFQIFKFKFLDEELIKFANAERKGYE